MSQLFSPQLPPPTNFLFNGRQRGPISNASVLPTQGHYTACNVTDPAAYASTLFFPKAWRLGCSSNVLLATLFLIQDGMAKNIQVGKVKERF